MFEKLLSLLPYNPNLAQQVRFYAKRMHQEAAIRRTGLIFLVLTFMVQFFAVISPPKPTAADAPVNDLLTGGVSSASDAAAQCVNNTRGYQVILHHYNISCNAFTGAETITIHSSNQNYYSMGHDSSGSDGRELPICPENHDLCAGKLYWRKLSIWPEPKEGKGSKPGWKALQIHAQGGRIYYVLYDCGNLVSVGIPNGVPFTPPPAPKPTPVITHAQTNTQDVTAPPATPTVTPPPTPCQYNAAIAATSSLCYPPCPYSGSVSASDVSCKPCDKSVNSQDKLACVQVRKTAANSTENISDANNTTAQPGDIILYTLYAQNVGKADVSGYTFQENLNDVLDYADVTDLHGGNMDANGIASWPKQEVKAGETISVQITVKVKSPVPSTPTSTSDPAHFDLIMTNVYGNTINIKLPSPVIKTIETATTGPAASLPNTGPGTSLFIAAIVVMTAGYFYSRARLLATESELAVEQNTNI